MARPQKTGLDYFPLDVDIDQADDDVQILEAKYGTDGFCVLIKLYMKAYQDKGYYIKWGEKEGLLLSKRVNVDINHINAIIKDLVAWGIFDGDIYKKHSILTSNGIQKRYLEAVSRRSVVNIDARFLISKEVPDNINLINVDINPQRKEEESKLNKNKVYKLTDFGLLIESDIYDFIEHRKSISKPFKSQSQVTRFLNKLEKDSNNNTDLAKSGIDKAIANGYQGVFIDEKLKPKQHTHTINTDIQNDPDRNSWGI